MYIRCYSTMYMYIPLVYIHSTLYYVLVHTLYVQMYIVQGTSTYYTVELRCTMYYVHSTMYIVRTRIRTVYSYLVHIQVVELRVALQVDRLCMLQVCTSYIVQVVKVELVCTYMYTCVYHMYNYTLYRKIKYVKLNIYANNVCSSG